MRSCDLQLRQLGGVSSFAGPVRTVRCREDNLLVKQVLATAGEGAVLVVDAGSAVANGWSGVVVHGVVRDSVALTGLALGVKALGTNPRKSRKEGVGQVDAPVGFGGVTFTPGEWVFSDEDGLLVLSPEQAAG